MTTAPSSSLPDEHARSAMLARQAIVNSAQKVVGFELFNRSQLHGGHTAASDVLMVFTALSHAGSEELVGKVPIFVNCTHESLSGGHLELVNPEKMVLEIPPLGHLADSEVQARLPVLEQLRARGFHLAFSHSVLESAYAAWLPLANYIKIDLSVLRADQVSVLIKYAKRHSQAELIAEKVETKEQFDFVSNLGVALFQGYWFARPTLVKAKLLSPSQARVVQLINLVRTQASTDEIEEVLKKDAALAFNLLRLVNSASMGLAREVSSFRQAVMLLGLKKLFRWAALLLTSSRASGAPAAIGQNAVVRGRLMELLALKIWPKDEADQAFVIGIFSMLDQMLGMPLVDAVTLLNINDASSAALLEHAGPMGQLLRLAIACETGDAEPFEQAASALGLDNQQINWSHLQALAWADQIPE